MPPGLPSISAVGSALQFGSESLAWFAGTLVQNHEIQLHPPAANIATPLNKLANERLIFGRCHTCTSTIGKSPEMPCGHSPGCPRRFAATASGLRSCAFVKTTDAARSIEQDNVIRCQRHLAQLILTPVPGAIERSVDGLRIAESFGYLYRGLPSFGRSGHERDSHDASRLETHAPSQAENGIQHRTAGLRQKSPGVQSRGAGRSTAAPEKAHTIRLVLDCFARRNVWCADVNRPDRVLVRTPWPPADQ